MQRFLTLFLFLAWCFPAFADTLYFTAGDSIKGLVVEEHRDRIVLSTEHGEQTILRRDIDEIFYAEPERNYLYLGNQALEEGETALARGFYQKALQANPAFREAQDALQRLADAERKKAEPAVPDPLDALWRRWGMALETAAGSTVISHLREDSPLAETGLEPSDVFVAYWDESLLYLPAGETAQILLGPAGTEIKITIRRIVPVSAALEVKRNWPGWNLEMNRLGLTVREATPGGAAAVMGVKPGDRIVELNGQPTRYLPLGQARRIIQKSRDKGLALVLHRDLIVRRP